MKRVKQTTAAAAMTAALLFGGAGAAQAAIECGPAGAHDRVIVKEITENGCEEVGGGTWCYGTGTDSATGLKSCFSDYFHPSSRHSATASIANVQSRDVQDGGAWAKAYAVGDHDFTCYTRYNPDAS